MKINGCHHWTAIQRGLCEKWNLKTCRLSLIIGRIIPRFLRSPLWGHRFVADAPFCARQNGRTGGFCIYTDYPSNIKKPAKRLICSHSLTEELFRACCRCSKLFQTEVAHGCAVYEPKDGVLSNRQGSRSTCRSAKTKKPAKCLICSHSLTEGLFRASCAPPLRGHRLVADVQNCSRQFCRTGGFCIYTDFPSNIKKPAKRRVFLCLAERQGFEPWMGY